MKNFFKILLLVLICCIFSVEAANAVGLEGAFRQQETGPQGEQSESNLDSAARNMGFDTGVDSVLFVPQTLIQILLSFLGVIFIILMVYGGYLWMTAHGNEDQLTKAKKLITAAIIGLIVVLAAYAITWFVMKQISTQTLQS